MTAPRGERLAAVYDRDPALFFEQRTSRDNPAGCWEWLPRRDYKGYGRVDFRAGGGRVHFAHRISYETFVGPIPDGLQIDHLCRNRPCCNPDHLEAVTPLVNTLRSDTPGARAVRLNACKRGHDFTPDNTYLTRDGRQCRACMREARRKKRSAERADRADGLRCLICRELFTNPSGLANHHRILHVVAEVAS